MRRRRCLIVLLLCATGAGGLARPTLSYGQQAPLPSLQEFAYADSLSAALYQQGRWRALDSVGRAALAVGTDYPALRRRLGAAAQARGKPGLALRHYGRALRDNSLDSAARLGLVGAYLTLGQREPATFYARALADSVRRALHLRQRYPVQRLEVELSGQSNASAFRGDAGFTRLVVGSQLSPRLFLTQAGSYFGQVVDFPELAGQPTYRVRQWEYYALLTAQLGGRWQARAGYHHLYNRFGAKPYPGRVVTGAVAYAHPYVAVVIGGAFGSLTDTTRTQLDLRATAYPLGNLRLYGFGRASVVRSAGDSFLNGMVGFGGQVRPGCWAELFGSTGRVPVLTEADGAYVYNFLDPQVRRGGAGIYFALPHQLGWRVYYTAEQRRRALSTATYSLYALTTALVWTW